MSMCHRGKRRPPRSLHKDTAPQPIQLLLPSGSSRMGPYRHNPVHIAKRRSFRRHLRIEDQEKRWNWECDVTKDLNWDLVRATVRVCQWTDRAAKDVYICCPPWSTAKRLPYHLAPNRNASVPPQDPRELGCGEDTAVQLLSTTIG